ncbi:MAG: hypothetical protein KDJ16_17675 [Hyphomicrobiales bacterium]|nr:hypothetical protein [Hyphomicrobiales bacterium]
MMAPWILRSVVGAATVVLGTFAALVIRGDHIETDLGERAAAMLSRSGQDWGAVTIDGRDLSLSGTAPTDGHRQMGVQAAGRTWGIRAVENSAEILPVALPFVWTAERLADGKVQLAGAVPYGEARDRVAAAFAGADIDVVDNAETAAGAPSIDGWIGAAEFSAHLLAGLAEGKATIADREISVTGTARDAAHFSAMKEAVSGALPAGFTLRSAEIRPPRISPYTFAAERDGRALSLSGYLPTVELGSTLRSAAAKHLPGVVVGDATEPGSGEPKAFAEAAAAAIAALALVDRGAVTFNDGELAISGHGRHLDTAADIRAVLNSTLPTSYRIATLEISPPLVEPYYFSAEKRGDSVVLGGFYPDAATRAAIAKSASEVLPGIAATDNLVPGAGAPAGYAEMARYALNLLAPLAEGRVSLTDLELRVKGRAADDTALSAYRAAVDASAPAGLALVDEDVSTGKPGTPEGANALSGQSGPPGVVFGDVPPPPFDTGAVDAPPIAEGAGEGH